MKAGLVREEAPPDAVASGWSVTATFLLWSLLGTLVKCLYPVTGREGVLAGEGCYVSDSLLCSLSSLSLIASLPSPCLQRYQGSWWDLALLWLMLPEQSES